MIAAESLRFGHHLLEFEVHPVAAAGCCHAAEAARFEIERKASHSHQKSFAPAEFKRKDRAGTHVDCFSVLFSTTRGRVEVLDGMDP